MQPDTQTPAPQPGAPNPYDFILQPPETPKQSFLSGGGLAKKLLVVVGFAAVLIVLIIVGLSFLLGRNGPDTQALLSLTARQQEIIRISEAGVEQSRGATARNAAATAELTIRTDQKALAAYVRQQGVSDKELTAGLNAFKSTETDSKLSSAATNNNYDEVFTEVLTALLQGYATKIKETYDGSGNTSLRTLLNTQYSNASLLLSSLSPAT
jgi:hypothetical protein